MVVVDPHGTALEAMCGIPVEMLTAVPALASAVVQECGSDAVIIAPDLGAVKLAEHYASLLERPVAVVRKTRVSGAAVRAEQMAGDVAGRPAVIIDDMISTGATIEAAASVLLAHGAEPSFVVAATHGLLLGGAAARLERIGVRSLVTTDSCRRASHQRPRYRLSPLPRCWPTLSAACTTTSRWGICWFAPDHRRHRGGSGRRVDPRPGPGLVQGNLAARIPFPHRDWQLRRAASVNNPRLSRPARRPGSGLA